MLPHYTRLDSMHPGPSQIRLAQLKLSHWEALGDYLILST